jgi:hypothetical protein
VLRHSMAVGFVVFCFAGSRAAEIPVANLVANPGIEEGRDGRPLGWRFGTAEPDNFVADWADGGRSGKCLHLKARSGKMSGYWGQTVAVEPGKTYEFNGYYRLAGGKILCYAHGRMTLPGGDSVSAEQRFYRASMHGHWLTPVFLAPEVLAGPKPDVWYPFELRLKVPPPIKAVSLSLGMYFTAGEAWFDDLWFGLAPSDRGGK